MYNLIFPRSEKKEFSGFYVKMQNAYIAESNKLGNRYLIGYNVNAGAVANVACA